jgi:RecB family endonuclease NucS
MRIVIADCSVIYTGRGDTKMKRAVRSIIVKSDGAVSIHNDKGNKPLNYMGATRTIFSESIVNNELVWQFENTQDNLTITLHHVISDANHALDLHDEGLVKDGTEKHLQEWLAENPSAVGEGFTFVAREVHTGEGHVDLLMKDALGFHVAVEVKRVAMSGAVDQVLGYLSALEAMDVYGPIKGMIVALDVRPKTLKKAERRGVECVAVAEAWKNRDRGPALEPAPCVDELIAVS